MLRLSYHTMLPPRDTRLPSIVNRVVAVDKNHKQEKVLRATPWKPERKIHAHVICMCIVHVDMCMAMDAPCPRTFSFWAIG